MEEAPDGPYGDIEAKIARAERVLEQRRLLVEELENLGAESRRILGDLVPGLRTWIRSLQPSSKGPGSRLGWRDALNKDHEDWQADPDMAQLLAKVIDQESQIVYERAKWEIMKRCQALIAVGTSAAFPRSPPEVLPMGDDKVVRLRKPPKGRWISVEAVVDSGNEWIKMISLTEKTLLYQMAEAGCWDDSDDEDEDEEEANEGDTPTGGETPPRLSASEEEIALVKTIKDLVFAARLNHTRRLRIIFTKIEHGRTKEVDKLLERIRSSCDHENMLIFDFSNGDFLAQTPPPLDTAIENLLKRDPFVDITETANLDPSAMLGLISDVNHGEVEKQGPEQKMILNRALQFLEDSASLPRDEVLVKNIYPALQGRKLVCTRSAAQYFRRVVNLLSTDTEMERTSLVLQADIAEGEQQKPADQLLREFQALTNYPVPSDLRLPIEIVDDFTAADVQPAIDKGILPKMALAVSKEISDMNRSIYFHGWAKGITTVSSHRGVVRQVELLVAKNWEKPGDYGPHTWQRWMAGFLLYRDKPKDWLEIVGGTAPPELRRWPDGKTTWGRGINIFGITDSPTWEGVGTWVEEKD
ncbi:uncharacterized protein E0L32_006874 [Thyridium curvatum]|uniref:DUF1308 domain-containing protein n=1 Tax=Thyridium curvatum TaxID=1093900 RepID=A0A507AR35_9PEZI|nr:uncharacterized protein E0L32_006874 [Thyridium curvatum]TPX12462.1 hypothetical protein E0L32_006874 [Thyridium curvatum]